MIYKVKVENNRNTKYRTSITGFRYKTNLSHKYMYGGFICYSGEVLDYSYEGYISNDPGFDSRDSNTVMVNNFSTIVSGIRSRVYAALGIPERFMWPSSTL